jgi:hypothetical protein
MAAGTQLKNPAELPEIVLFFERAITLVNPPEQHHRFVDASAFVA